MWVDLGETSCEYLREYVRRLRRATEVLPPEDTWWRPHSAALSTGTILVHLTGNVRQWIVSGIGGAEDTRDRALEFARERGADATELLGPLEEAVEAAASVIEGMDPEAYSRSYRIQGSAVAGWKAVYHVVEHFSWHTGQAVWIAKSRAGEDHGVAFYDDEQVDRLRNE